MRKNPLLMPPNRWDVTYDSSRRFEQLIQIISIPYKGLSEHEKEIIRIAHRDYLNNLKITPMKEFKSELFIETAFFL